MGSRRRRTPPRTPPGYHELQAYLGRIRELQARSPMVSPEYLWGYLRSVVEPAMQERITETVKEATLPKWEEARLRGEETARLAVPKGSEDVGRYFAERFGKYVTELAGRKYEEVKPTVYEDIRKLVESIMTPEASVAYGMTKEAPKWEAMHYGEATSQVLSQIQEFRKNYEEILNSLNKYFRETLGIKDFDASKLFSMVWGD